MQVENPEKNRRKHQKTGKIEKNTVVFSIFGKIFQTFRKSYVLMPSHGERKWRRKSGKKPLRKGFREIVEKTYKKSEFWGIEDTVGKETLGYPTKRGDLLE